MKKNVLSFLMLILCIGILPSKTFAQDAPGTEGSDGISVDGGTTPVSFNPPTYVSNCKRNNGNGTSSGLAEVRLNFSDKKIHPVSLLEIRNLDGTPLKGQAVMDITGNPQNGYMSYALYFNIPPKNKLIFHFCGDGADYWVPECN